MSHGLSFVGERCAGAVEAVAGASSRGGMSDGAGSSSSFAPSVVAGTSVDGGVEVVAAGVEGGGEVVLALSVDVAFAAAAASAAAASLFLFLAAACASAEAVGRTGLVSLALPLLVRMPSASSSFISSLVGFLRALRPAVVVAARSRTLKRALARMRSIVGPR